MIRANREQKKADGMNIVFFKVKANFIVSQALQQYIASRLKLRLSNSRCARVKCMNVWMCEKMIEDVKRNHHDVVTFIGSLLNSE